MKDADRLGNCSEVPAGAIVMQDPENMSFNVSKIVLDNM